MLIDLKGVEPVNTISSFTDDQQKAYETLMNFINSPFDKNNFSYSLIGPAGSGKTYLLSAIIRNCNLSTSVIGLAAPTHKACRVLGTSLGTRKEVNTIASDLGYSMNLDLDDIDIKNPKFVPTRPAKIKNYRLYIIDEASMLGYRIVTKIEQIAKQHQVKIIWCGDASQLHPVNENNSYAFSHSKHCELKQIVRQGDNNPISKLLTILRNDVKHRTHNFLSEISKHPTEFDSNNIKGYQCLPRDAFRHMIDVCFSDDQITRNVDFAKIVAYTNDAVNTWNKYVRSRIIENSEKAVITKNDLIMAYTSIVDRFLSFDIKNSEDYIVHDIVNFTQPKTGINGYMVKFQAIHGGAISNPLFVVDHRNMDSVTKYYTVSNHLISAAKDAPVKYRAEKWKNYYQFKNTNLLITDIKDINGTTIFRRDLDYGFAITAHKSQGSTYDTVFVDLKDILYNKIGYAYNDINDVNRRLYVATSRARNKLYFLV